MSQTTDFLSAGETATRILPKGRLKIFLGPCPGVGKTFSMLQAAAERKGEGIDVAVGLIETHQRKETQEQLANLEILPRRIISYRGHRFEELDLDGILARAPKLVLIDECAHSNLPGSRHPKRYNDIEEILEYGIDVYTTLNIQHLESLKDIIGQMTRITIRESIPDSFVHSADEIQLIDLPPDDLLQRLADGKIYMLEQAQAAIDHFFSRSNLLALRELALRHTVAVADEEMARHVRLQGIKGPWPASDKVLVFVDDSTSGPHLIRTAHRVAGRLQARWTAITVETPDDENRSLSLQQQLSQTLHLAEELGAKVVALEGANVARTIVEYALATNTTDLIIGQNPRVSFWQKKLFRWQQNVAGQILSYHPALTLRVMPAVNPKSPSPDMLPLPSFFKKTVPYLLSTVISLTVVLGVWQITRLTLVTDVAPFFFLGILCISIGFGLKPALLSTVICSLAYNYYYVDGAFQMGIYSLKGWLSFLSFTLGSLVMSTIALQSRNIFSISQGRLRQIRFFSAFVHNLVLCTHREAVLHHLCRQMNFFLKIPIIGFWDSQPDQAPIVQYPETKEIRLTQDDTNAVQWALAHQSRSGRSTENFSDAHYLYLPLKIGNNSLGVVGIWAFRNQLMIEDFRVAQTLIDQAALAIDRLNHVTGPKPFPAGQHEH